MDTQLETKSLICALTEEEIRERAHRAAELDQEIVKLEDDFEAVRKDHKAKVGVSEVTRRILLREVREKQTCRDVLCEVTKIYAPDFVVQTMRTDTGEIIHQRPMTIDERQGQLVGINGGPSRHPASAEVGV